MMISKQDWKLFCERISDWQERYMAALTKEYIKLLSADGDASDKFWALEKRINKDKKRPGVTLELEKSEAIWDIAILLKDKVITMDDLADFSDELKDEVINISKR